MYRLKKRYNFTCCFIIVLSILSSTKLKSQILHTERFSAILDTSKVIKGNFLPSFRYRNIQKDFFEIENRADISLKIGKNIFSLANKFEFSRFGNENILSGGFLYLEYQRLNDDAKFSLEPYVMRLWQENRGLELKYAAGSNLRYAIIRQKSFGAFAGVGMFYEWEKWNYQGTRDIELIPDNPQDIISSAVRLASYFSFKKTFAELITIDASYYYQPRLKNFLDNYRTALSASATYNISNYVGLTVLYQNIYDPNPIVPIPEWYNDITLGLSVSF